MFPFVRLCLHSMMSSRHAQLGLRSDDSGQMLSKLGSAANMIVNDIQQNLSNAKAGESGLSFESMCACVIIIDQNRCIYVCPD